MTEVNWREGKGKSFLLINLRLTLVVILAIDVTRARAQVRDHDQQVDDACVPGHLRVAIARGWVSQGHTGRVWSGQVSRAAMTRNAAM